MSEDFELGPPPPIFIPPLGPVSGAVPPVPAAPGSASPPPAASSPPAAPAPAPKPAPAAPAPKPAPAAPAPAPAKPAPKPSGGSSAPAPAPKPAEKPAEPAAAPSSDLVFPLWIKPSASWKDGPRYFGCPRSKGRRKHAGVDLYAPFGSKIRAIADGEIIQPPYGFYDGTNALEVYHPGIGVVRYGEISSSKVVHVKSGQKVKVGEHIAYVGLLDSLQMSMIHFELFGAEARGKNLSGGGPFRRHPALKDPTSLVDKLFKLTFG